ncbi:hypothetical protein [Prauserella muralis]|uniref:hypothetical protein n=1 Tax=Prauserella muralis TaxID=588067 RepID=UPI0011AD005C|nr:hypothetical protein [Prauserella muralis]TWE13727.1 hypothetical protein FHX69_5855 [Prauserella muralis]
MTSGGFFDDPVDTGVGIGAVFGGAAAKAIGAIDAKAVEATKAATQRLVAEAKSGGFRISEEGVAPLQDALTKMTMELDMLTQSMDFLTQAPKLGSHAYGQTVASHDQKSAANELGSAAVVLRQFGEVVRQASEALTQASKAYKANEENQQSTFGGN